MTNTKFRKRALLSSVAMLLVALVALGSATFAWFAESPTASANGLTLKTTAASGLEIQTASQQKWGTEALLNADAPQSTTSAGTFNLTPASQVQNVSTTGHAGDFYTVTAKKADEPDAKDEKFTGVTAGRSSADSVYAEDIFFRLSQTSSASDSRTVKLSGVTITVASGASTLSKAIRVAVADENGLLLGTYSVSGSIGDDGKDCVPYNPGNTTYDNLTLTAYNPALTTNLTSGSATAVDVEAATGVMTTSTTKKVTVYVYLDGEDSECFTQKVNNIDVNQLISGVVLDFTLAPKA